MNVTPFQDVSPVFLSFFYKHFPQLKGRLSKDQLSHLRSFAGFITHKTSDEDIWAILESHAGLLHGFGLIVESFLPYIRVSRRPEFLLILSMIGLLASLALVLVFEESLTSVVMNMVSFAMGVFGTCLKESFGRYFSLIVEKNEP